MAATTIVNLQVTEAATTDSRLTFLLKALQECAPVYRLAKEARARIVAYVSSVKSFASGPRSRQHAQRPLTTRDAQGAGGMLDQDFGASSDEVFPAPGLPTGPDDVDWPAYAQRSMHGDEGMMAFDSPSNLMSGLDDETSMMSMEDGGPSTDGIDIMNNLQGWFSLGMME
ncbi:hypothetical protein A1O3_03705 [Capronia epimyces CBS 606.96]|uniref:Uncharacterized protein n=1 Tax=Capronia epimyces CBS 606.96 TaxID=1182542 RepID=W9YBV8_9EURO|nr:uncharacterized protein A1O3_03705 [Capronia epimyces CBS 606.96]EXJ86751.1 hypothetical protein A1O3_03705 [Capronia epimyces CBS 606.96]